MKKQLQNLRQGSPACIHHLLRLQAKGGQGDVGRLDEVDVVKAVGKIDGEGRAFVCKIVANPHLFKQLPGSCLCAGFSGKGAAGCGDVPQPGVAGFVQLSALDEQLTLRVKQADVYDQMVVLVGKGFSIDPSAEFTGFLAVDVVDVPKFHGTSSFTAPSRFPCIIIAHFVWDGLSRTKFSARIMGGFSAKADRWETIGI